MSDKPTEQSHGRRTMFRFSLKRLMDPVVEYIEDRFNIALPMERLALRPPGALPEREFLDTCYRCGNCIDVCPARAIRTLSGDRAEGAGTPFIDPDLAACVVCDDLACMKACPSGALKAVADRTQIDMGLARVDAEVCLRSRGDSCTLCVEKCPMGSAAISISPRGEVVVNADGCVGCGACQFFCPTVPKAIRVRPA